MSQTVLMEVECIGPECASCPELELNSRRYNLCFEDRYPEFSNEIFCKHYRKCERIMGHLRKNSNADNEKDGV